tara:strand:+ start:5047 stop:6069 length:1023 start_codon:yes stop_codon:yes gene_type:complete
LISAAYLEWPETEIFGVDIDPHALKETKELAPNLKAYMCDFLSEECLLKTKNILGRIDLVLLNPPFSCKSSEFVTTVFEDEKLRCSKAMAFLLGSCKYLSDLGEVLAIVPRSCLLSSKDSKAREALTRHHILEDFGPYARPRFREASVTIHLVRISKRQHSCTTTEPHPIGRLVAATRDYNVIIMRGTHPVSASSECTERPSLIHTTNLCDGKITKGKLNASKQSRLVSGPVVMLPRVARPTKDKVCFGYFDQPIVPSDCVICVKTLPSGYEQHLQDQLLLYWDGLKNTYSGTCAAYLTLEMFKEFLLSIGFKAEVGSDLTTWMASTESKTDWGTEAITG